MDPLEIHEKSIIHGLITVERKLKSTEDGKTCYDYSMTPSELCHNKFPSPDVMLNLLFHKDIIELENLALMFILMNLSKGLLRTFPYETQYAICASCRNMSILSKSWFIPTGNINDGIDYGDFKDCTITIRDHNIPSIIFSEEIRKKFKSPREYIISLPESERHELGSRGFYMFLCTIGKMLNAEEIECILKPVWNVFFNTGSKWRSVVHLN